MKAKEINKSFRSDLRKWETKINLFWFINYYKYSIFNKGVVENSYRLFKIKGGVYIDKAFEFKPKISKQEFKNVYNSNKWIVPINYEL